MRGLSRSCRLLWGSGDRDDNDDDDDGDDDHEDSDDNGDNDDDYKVSPPNEHIQGPTWWTRYQPVSYKMESRWSDFCQITADHRP